MSCAATHEDGPCNHMSTGYGLQGQGIHYDTVGNEYQGSWVRGVREGQGLQIYVDHTAESSAGDVYEGSWVQDNRLTTSATGCMHVDP